MAFMANIRLLFRSTNSGLKLSFNKPIVRPAVRLWSSSAPMVRQWPQVVPRLTACSVGGHQWFRSMSYVSNIKRFPRRYRQSVRLVAIGLAIGCAVVAFETIYQYLRLKYRSKRQLSSASKLLVAEEVPQMSATRIVSGPTDLGVSLTLYQYQSCPFCCKVRAFLDYYGIPYNVVEVNPVLRQQLKFSEYRKVPILLIQSNGVSEVLQINDSTTIVSALSSYMISRKPDSNHRNESLQSIAEWYRTEEVVKENGAKVDEIVNRYFLMFGDIEKQRLNRIEGTVAEERNWRRWADDYLVHTLSPNIYRTLNESLRSFRYFAKIGEWDKNFKVWEQYLCIYLGSSAMYLIGKRLKKKHSLGEDVRNSLYDSCRHWLKAIGKDRKFMGGERPNLADLAVYGVLNSIEGCDAFNDMIEKTKIGFWYYSVQELVKNKAGIHELNYIKT